MSGGTVSFDEAARLLAFDNGLSRIEAERVISAAITDGGVAIFERDGKPFTWLERPGRSASGCFVAPSNFDVFKVGNGWSDLDLSSSRSGNTLARSSRYYRESQGAASQYGLSEDWTYDCLTLSRAVQRIYGFRVHGLAQELTKAPVPNRGGAPEKSVVSELKVLLGAHLAAHGLPESSAKAPAELVKWCQNKCTEMGWDEPAKSTIEGLVSAVLGAHRDAMRATR
ncbi:MAG: hypothetical protein KDK75_08935 [Alphaproteobacteria bacterium]|nr:hypothetical protein [Alphaproteobacteria bacterium]